MNKKGVGDNPKRSVRILQILLVLGKCLENGGKMIGSALTLRHT